MVKFTTHIKHIYRITLLILITTLVSNISFASTNINYVIISGQIINMEYGNPVVGHQVFINSDSTRGGLNGYYKILKTNKEGYYCDTVVTTEDKGSLIVYTYDYLNNTLDTTVHFRFMDRSNSIIIADFYIYMPYQADKLQARFKYTKEHGDDKNIYSFEDQTKGDSIIDWHWDFGDGNTSNIQNPAHLYQSVGLFKITFTVTAMINRITTTSVITKQLYITDQDYFHLGGHVFSDHFPIDIGLAYLYLIDTFETYIAVDTIAFDTLGYYYFYHIPKGNYLIKVEPMCESQYYGLLLPTYYGNKLFWADSEIIELKNTSWEYDIKLEHADGLLQGEGSISGNVAYDNLPRTFHDYYARGINIFLLDEMNNKLTCHYSDDIGNFTFDFIELNTYWLYPEITGINAEKIKVELTPETPYVNDIEIKILLSSISYVIPNDDIYSGNVVGLPYPNPVSENLSIPLNLAVSNNGFYEVYNMYGQVVISGEIEMRHDSHSYQVSTKSINNGSYILRTKVNNKYYNHPFVVSK